MSQYGPSPEAHDTLGGRLGRLQGQIGALGERMKEGIAGAVGAAISEALRDVVRGLLGVSTEPGPQDFRNYHRRDDNYHEGYQDDRRHGYGGHDGWGDDDRPGSDWHRQGGVWREDDQPDPDEPAPARRGSPDDSPLKAAGVAAVQAGLWWLRQQRSRRPLLTTLLVAGAAAVVALVAGPTAVTSLGVASAVAGVVLTADTAQALVGRLGGALGR